MIAYLWLAIIGHEVGEDVVRRAQHALGPRVLHAALVVAAVLLAVRVTMRLGMNFPGDGPGAAGVRRAFAAFVAGALVLCYVLLVAIPTEAAHFVQYALPVFPLFFLSRRLGATIVTLSLAGVVDEGWQYWILHPHWGVSLDFNDIVMNVLGASLGALLILLDRPIARRTEGLGQRLRRADVPVTRLLAVIVAAVCVARLGGLVSFVPGDAAAGAIRLSRSAPDPFFWTFASWSQKRFHALTPGVGLLVTTGLVGALALLDSFVVVRTEVPVGRARRAAP